MRTILFHYTALLIYADFVYILQYGVPVHYTVLQVIIISCVMSWRCEQGILLYLFHFLFEYMAAVLQYVSPLLRVRSRDVGHSALRDPPSISSYAAVVK